MKLLLLWPVPDPAIEVLFAEFKRAGHEIVYWVGERPVVKLCPPGAVFHDHYDAWDATPAEKFADMPCLPIPKDVIESLFEVESLALTMMNKRYDAAPVDERKHIYYGMLSYWSAVLERCKPDAIVFSMLPHSVYNYILYELARRRGISTILFDDAWFVGRLIMYRDIWSGSAPLTAALGRHLKSGIQPSDLGEEFRAYYARQSDGALRTPSYMQEQKSIAAGTGLAKHRIGVAVRTLRNGTFIRYFIAFCRRMFRKNLKDEYARVVRTADFSKRFVYFPLSFQPERTTSPQGGVYHDQILVAETVAAALPQGWELYVKEHPSQWWRRSKERYSSARYRGYYERLARIPNARLVPVDTDNRALLERSQAIATVTGTAGWEGLLRSKPALVFGFVWYCDCPGVIRIRSLEECKIALQKIASGEHTVKQGGVIAFLKALEDTSVRAYAEDHTSDPSVPHIPMEESMRALGEAICAELRRPNFTA